MKILHIKLIWFLPILAGGVIGGILTSNQRSNTSILSPIIPPSEDVRGPNLDKTTSEEELASEKGSLQQQILTSQSLLAKAIEISKEKDSAQNQRIVQLINEAITTINQAIGQYPSDHRAWAQRAKIYQTIKGYMPEAEKVAIGDWQRAIKLDPNNSDYYQSLASIYQVNGIKIAIFYLQKAVETNPTDPNLLKQLAEYQTRAGMLSQARTSYQQILAILIDQEQREVIKKEIKGLERLIVQAGIESDAATPERSIPFEESTITLPESPPLLEARHLASNTIIAAPVSPSQHTSGGETISSALSGMAILPTGETEVKICNENLSPNTQVYLVSEGEDENQVLIVKRKVPFDPETNECSHFVAAIQKPLNQDLKFRWWLIEN